MADPGDVVNILPQGNLKEDLGLIENSFVLEAMMQLQELPREERRRRNINFVKSISEHTGGSQEGFVWMNENLHGSTCKTILADLDYSGGCKDNAVEKVEDAKDAVRALLGCAAAPKADGMSFCSVLKRIRMVILLYFDVLKDILVFAAVFNIAMHMNGDTSVADTIVYIITSGDFPSVLVQLMFLSIVIPIVASAITMMFRDPTIMLGGEAWYRFRKNKPSSNKIVAMKIFTFVFYLMMPAVLINTREEAKSKLQLWIESKREETRTNTIRVADLSRIRLVNLYLEETRVAFLIFKRNELTLESVVQLFLQGVMVLLSPSYTEHTATYSGLQSVFKENQNAEEEEACKGYDLGCHIGTAVDFLAKKGELAFGGTGDSSLKVLLILSVLISIKTTVRTYVKIKTEEKIKFFSLESKVFLALRALVAYTTRAVCIVAFFVPFLGLLDVLAHWKADQVSKDADDRSHYDKYTGVTLGVAFGYFMLGLIIQTGLALLVKMAMNKEFKETSIGSKLQHIALIVNMPDNYGEWSSGGGDLAQLKRRQRRHLVESCVMILLQFVSHILMVIPFWVTGDSFKSRTILICSFFAAKNANVRQDALSHPETGGKTFKEENEAVEWLASVSWGFPLAIVATSVIDLVMVVAFQKWLHPWRRIIAKPKAEQGGQKED